MVMKLARSCHQRAKNIAHHHFFGSLVKQIGAKGKIDDTLSIFNYAARGNFGIISPIQSRKEFVWLLDRVKKHAPATVLEIGTANGGTLFMLTRAATPDALIISLDLPGGDWGGGYGEERVPLYEAFALPGQTLHLLRDDSHQPRSLQAVKDLLNGRTIDFLFIDGDHSYEGVKMDYEMYAPLVSPNGLIAFHDIAYTGGVERLWKEIAPDFAKVSECISEKPPVYGIGLAQKRA